MNLGESLPTVPGIASGLTCIASLAPQTRCTRRLPTRFRVGDGLRRENSPGVADQEYRPLLGRAVAISSFWLRVGEVSSRSGSKRAPETFELLRGIYSRGKCLIPLQEPLWSGSVLKRGRSGCGWPCPALRRCGRSAPPPFAATWTALPPLQSSRPCLSCACFELPQLHGCSISPRRLGT